MTLNYRQKDIKFKDLRTELAHLVHGTSVDCSPYHHHAIKARAVIGSLLLVKLSYL
jgi:hypothetical protein